VFAPLCTRIGYLLNAHLTLTSAFVLTDGKAMTDATTTGDAMPRSATNDVWFNDFYEDLKRLARSRLRVVGGRTVLHTTMLVHDTYTRLAESAAARFSDRSQFMAYCAQTMRSVIIDLVRAHLAERRGGGHAHVELDTELMQSATDVDTDSLDVLRVHDALAQLRALDPRLEKIVEMRYFAGMRDAETAEALGIGLRTVTREWERARALLRAVLTE
jgi:RNA polymerase sigma factor (TIGR02999 family)